MATIIARPQAEMMPGLSRSADQFVVVLPGPLTRYARCHCHPGGKGDGGKEDAETSAPRQSRGRLLRPPQWTGSTVIRQMAIQSLNTQKYRAFRRHVPGTGNQ